VKVTDGLYMGSREQQSAGRTGYMGRIHLEYWWQTGYFFFCLEGTTSSTGGKLVTNLQRCDILPLLSVLVKYFSLQKKHRTLWSRVIQ
jgi:hypothetical protein